MKWWWLLFIFILALFLRLHNLDTVPSGFHQDEVANTYIGRFILENGVDLYGNRWPLLYFDKHGDYPPVVPMYISALGTYLFSITQMAGRLPIAVLGSLVIIPVFFITRLIFRNNMYATLAALMVAISPWHMSFSRIGSEGILATTVFMYGLWLMLLAYARKNIGMLIGGLALFLFTYLLYPAFRITAPVTLIVGAIMYGAMKVPYINQKKQNNEMPRSFGFILFAAAMFAFIATLYISTTSWGKGRYEQTSIFNKFSGVNNPANRFIYNEDNVLVARVFNNKVVYVGKEFLAEYMSYFSPDFLFTRGGKPDWFDVPNTGLFFIAQAILLIALFVPFAQKKSPIADQRGFLFLLSILFIAPLASALTIEFTPNTHRSILMSVMFVFLFIYCFALIQNLKLKKILTIGIFGIIAIEFVLFYHNYFQHVSMYTSVLRGDGNRQIVEYLDKEKANYDKIYMFASGWFPMYYLYFTNNFDKNLVGTFATNLRTEQVDNVRFIEQDCPDHTFFEGPNPTEKINPQEKVLAIVNSSCAFNYYYMYEKIGEITGADRVPVYHIHRFDPVRFHEQKGKIPGINFQ